MRSGVQKDTVKAAEMVLNLMQLQFLQFHNLFLIQVYALFITVEGLGMFAKKKCYLTVNQILN